jgi:hypothetical protein
MPPQALEQYRVNSAEQLSALQSQLRAAQAERDSLGEQLIAARAAAAAGPVLPLLGPMLDDRGSQAGTSGTGAGPSAGNAAPASASLTTLPSAGGGGMGGAGAGSRSSLDGWAGSGSRHSGGVPGSPAWQGGAGGSGGSGSVRLTRLVERLQQELGALTAERDAAGEQLCQAMQQITDLTAGGGCSGGSRMGVGVQQDAACPCWRGGGCGLVGGAGRPSKAMVSSTHPCAPQKQQCPHASPALAKQRVQSMTHCCLSRTVLEQPASPRLAGCRPG